MLRTVDRDTLPDYLSDQDVVTALFEGHARLDQSGRLLYDESYEPFVMHRLRLLESEVVIRDDGGSHSQVRLSVPAWDLHVSVRVPVSYWLVSESTLLYSILDQLRSSGSADTVRFEAAIPDLVWLLVVKRYLSVRRQLAELQQVMHDLERRLMPCVK